MAKIKDIEDLEAEKESAFIAKADLKKPSKNKGGRPKKNVEDKASSQIFINVKKAEKEACEKIALELGISVSALCKLALKQYIKKMED